MNLLENLPEIYNKLLPNLKSFEVLDEGFATCSDCIMACDENKSPDKECFSKKNKCCTYFPHLPNYLVGAILHSSNKNDLEGKKRMLEIIERRVGIYPSGIYPPKKYQSLYKQYSKTIFGKANSMLCPFYESRDGLCTIWKYREAVCSTFFCVHTSGKVGNLMWQSFRNFLLHIQEALVEYTLLKNNMSSKTEEYPDHTYNGSLTLEEFEQLPMEVSKYDDLWMNFSGNEVTFYQKCYDLVNNLTATDVERIAGVRGIAMEEGVRKAISKIGNKLPPILIVNPERKYLKDENGNSKFPLGKSKVALVFSNAILQLFDGKRNVDEILVEAEKLGIRDELFSEKLYVLYHHEYFIPPKY